MDIQNYLVDIVDFVNNIVIPFILGIAFLFFVINVIRYFVIGGSNQDSQEKARATATYSVAAFAFIIIFWGIINLLSSSLGFVAIGETTPRCFDYDPKCTDGNPANGNSGGFGNSPSQPGAGGGFSNSPTVTTPNTQDTPSRPAQPSGPGTPTDTADPNVSGAAEFTQVLERERAIAPVVQQFVAEDAESFYGANTNIVTSVLYADLTGNARSDQYSDIDRIRAMRRLELVEVVTPNETNDYVDLMETYYDSSQYDPNYFATVVEPASLQLVVPMPAQLRDAQSQTITQLSDELTTYYRGLNMDASEAQAAVSQDIAKVSSGTALEREAALEALYDANKVRDFDGTIYNRFIDDINTELAFQGEAPIR